MAISTFITDHMAHGHPSVTGFTDTYVMATLFLVVCVLAGVLIPPLRPEAGSPVLEGRLATAPEAG